MTYGSTADHVLCAIVGAAGYTGRELVRILCGHPSAQLVGLFGSQARDGAQSIADIHPSLLGVCELQVHAASVDAIIDLDPDVVFLCTPHEVSHDLAPALLEAGIVVLDLSAAFRLSDPTDYKKHYGFTHQHAKLIDEAVYGLAELNRLQIAETNLIAVPGCYPTSAILALRPLVEEGVLEAGSTPIIDSVSGVSGAGRSPRLGSLYCEVSQQPYGVFSHRHQPEIDLHAGIETIFTPHLGPFDRGILSTIHAQLSVGVTDADLRAIYSKCYAHEPFIRLLDQGVWPSVGAVEHTNFCDIALAVDVSKGHLIVCSAIDNLLKGAASQAVQCFNIRMGFVETIGLLPSAGEAAPA